MNDDQHNSALILIIDDQVANICLLQNILNRVGFSNIQSITDSREAYRKILSLKPDLIVLDLHMPHVTGYEILQQLNIILPRDHYVPVLVLTADGTALAKRRALAAGATDILQKPFDASEVMMRIRNLLRTRFLNLEVQNQNAILEQKVQERTRELSEAMKALEATQQQVLQQERLRAFSEMAGGVVHDFNNSLMSVVGYSDLLLSDSETLNDGATVVEYLKMINTAGNEAAQVISRLRDFYRPREVADVFAPINLNDLLEETVALTQPKWKDQAQASNRTIKVEFDLTKVPMVSGNTAELRKLAASLIFNSVDAMPSGGVITVRTRRGPSGGAIVEISDNGTGMTDEVRNKCLEPFFTTKGEHYTGLGLSTVFGIAKRHGGKLDVDSRLGKGTSFRVHFPPAAPERDPALDSASPYSRALSVLVVDDEPVTRQVVAKYLQMDGHEVVAVSNGRDALSRFRTGKFDLVLTDHAMPEMNGSQLAGAVKGLDPHLPVILLTGFDAAAAFKSDRPPAVDMVLQKPIPQAALRRALHEALDTACSGGLVAIA